MGYAPSFQIPASGSVVSTPNQLAAGDALPTGAVRVCPNLQGRPGLEEEQIVSSRMLIATLSTLLLATACVPQTLTFDLPSPTNTPSPTRAAEALTSSYTPTPQPVHTPATITPPVDCVMHGSSPPPSLPDTDCRAWEFLHSLVMLTNGMANKSQTLTAAELLTLETELNPLFVQAQINCGEWVEPYNDYEPLTDYLMILSVMGTDTYEYDASSLLRFILKEASAEEFAQQAESIGCVKSLLLLFVAYAE